MICCHFLSPPLVVSQKTCWDQWSHMAGGHFYPFTRFPISLSKLLITYCASEIQSMEEMPRKSHSRIFLWPYQSLSHCLTQDNTWKLLLSDWEIHFGQSRFSQQQGVETSYFITNTTFYKKKTSHLLSFNPEVNLSFKDFDLITYISISLAWNGERQQRRISITDISCQSKNIFLNEGLLVTECLIGWPSKVLLWRRNLSKFFCGQRWKSNESGWGRRQRSQHRFVPFAQVPTAPVILNLSQN